MKAILITSLSILALGVSGCGKKRTSSSAQAGGTVAPASLCSQEINNLHLELVRRAQAPLTRQSRLTEIVRVCRNFKAMIGNQTCLSMDSRARIGQSVSAQTHQLFCADAERLAGGSQNPPPPPVVVRPNPNPRPPRYDQRNVLIENLDGRYALVFLKSYLEPHELDVRKGSVRCIVSVPQNQNGYLRGERARFVAISIRTVNERSTYDMTAMLVNSNDLVRLTCRSLNSLLDIEDFNDVMEGLVEIRSRNR